MELFKETPEPKTLRKYQLEACNAVVDAWAVGAKPIITLATGTGKTIIMAELVRRGLELNRKTLMLAHREELVNQGKNKVSDHTGYSPAVEMAGDWANMGAKVVVGSVPTMQKVRLARWPATYFDQLFVDEAHHSICGTYRNIIDHFSDARILGVTATADRADDRQLGELYDTVAYDYPLHTAIKEGYLVPIKGRRCKDFSIDLSKLKVVAGDFTDEELGDVIANYIEPIAENVKKQTEGISTLCFMPNVKSSQLMAEALTRIGLPSGYISGAMDKDERRNTLYKYHMGTITHLCSCNVLLEGYDEPRTSAIVMLRPTGSRTVFAQAVGRGTRLHKGKDKLILVEFTFNSDKLRLVTAYELFATMGFGESVQERAKKKGESSDEEDFMDNIEKAHGEQYDRMAILRRMTIPTWGFTEFDPLELGNLFNVDLTGEFNISYKGHRLEGPATEKQLNLLKKYGVSKLDTIDKAQASALIDQFMQRNIYPSVGEASEAQKLMLFRLGHKQVENLTKAQASLLIEELKKVRWENEMDSRGIQSKSPARVGA